MRWRSQLLGNAYGNVGEDALAIEYSRRAFALIDRVSERERLAISAVYHTRVTGDAFHHLLLEIALMQEASKAILLSRQRNASDLLKPAADQARRANLNGSADVLREASAADPFGDCQVEDGLEASLREYARLN